MAELIPETTGIPTAGADPTVTLPAMTSTGGGPTAQFITAAATFSNRDLATGFVSLQPVLGCQTDKAGFGARTYRRNDGQWGGAMLVIAKSATQNLDALPGCVKSGWPGPAAGGPNSMRSSGWTYPTSGENHHPETYYLLLAGTASYFCDMPNGDYRNYATSWP